MRFFSTLILAALLVACEEPPREAALPPDSGAVIYDFVASFDPAHAAREVRRIDLGTAEARQHLREGWSFDQSEGGDVTTVWGRGEFSTLDVFVLRPRPITLRFRAKPLPVEGASAQRVTIFVNGTRIGDREIPRRWRDYELDTPASVWRDGRNRLRFEYAYSISPAESGGAENDHRPLAVLWDWLDLGDPRDEPRTRPFVEGGTLFLPLDTQVDYYLERQPGGRLVVDHPEAWSASGSAPPHRTEVVIQTAEPDRVEVHRIDGEARLALPESAGRTVRVSFRARSEPRWTTRLLQLVGWTGRPQDSGVALSRPVIRADDPIGPTAEEPPPRRDRPRKRPNVLVYLIDTLRADHLGCYGYDRPISPRIDEFAGESILFSRTFAQSSWTRSSVASLFTALLPQTHRVTGRKHSLPPEARTLAEALSDLGYVTAGVVTNPNVTPGYGFDQGFDHYVTLPQSSDREILRPSHHVNVSAFDWLDHREEPDRPFLLYLHTTDPHAPYTPREPFRTRFAAEAPPELGEMPSVKRISAARMELSDVERRSLVDLYDAEIAFNDSTFGELVDGLKERGLYESTLIVLVSDHGEEFFDHGGWQHGITLYEEQLHVPFVIRLPRGELGGRTVDVLAQLVDVYPTVLEALGEPAPEGVDGRSLLSAMEGTPDGPRTGIAHLDLDDHRLEAILSGERKLIRWLPARPYSRVELYDLGDDPAEQTDLSGDLPLEGGRLQTRLAEITASASSMEAREVEVPPEVEERLRALGYLQ